jgi:hypothetical protein
MKDLLRMLLSLAMGLERKLSSGLIPVLNLGAITDMLMLAFSCFVLQD